MLCVSLPCAGGEPSAWPDEATGGDIATKCSEFGPPVAKVFFNFVFIHAAKVVMFFESRPTKSLAPPVPSIMLDLAFCIEKVPCFSHP